MKLRYCNYKNLMNFNKKDIALKHNINVANIYLYLNFKFKLNFLKLVYLYFYMQFLDYCIKNNIKVKFNYNFLKIRNSGWVVKAVDCKSIE